MLKQLFLLLTFLSLAILSPLSNANETEEIIIEEILIDSDNQDLNYKEKTLHFSGNVIVKKGNISIYADELFVETNEKGESKKLIAKGNLAKFSQQGEGSLDISSEALEITYLVIDEILTFNGRATLKQGTSEVTGDTIEFDLVAQRVKAEGDEAENGRVTTRLKVKKS